MATAQGIERLDARITTAQKALLREAAGLRGVTLTNFVISSAYEAAVQTLQATRLIELGRRDQRAFVEALIEPAAPNRRLRAAAARHGWATKAAKTRRR